MEPRDAAALRVFREKRDELVYGARLEARVKACSYRGFLVGCQVLASNESGEYKVFGGANLKPLKYGHRECAEMIALGNAFEADYDRIIAIVVAGEPQADSESRKESPTLHPCGRCRKLMISLCRLPRETVILTASLEEGGAEEEQSFGALLEFHSTHVVLRSIV